MQSKRIVIIAQLLISMQMAFLMTGIFSFIKLGMTTEWAMAWLNSFLVAWPIAFALSLIVSKVSFSIALRIDRALP
ncbi:DUF2798 domain-containing protein [Marinomonas mediterranea]|uniref:DUF2798 domain-containing protein n=1 Tax=Marinomonas mediterranea TaxID=119864 RepID=UPI002349A44C|nr:DUF2798 domain-containing protein [Marinomonas mediterranea]WCN10998.1 DUF2798 domain-containing protein [Marinomonas mediterranea]